MNEKEKQIEEMATDVCRCLVWDQDGYATVDCLITAENLHHIGYRKQSEGEWVTKGDIFKTYHCSVCNYSVDYPKQKTTYCPECGARMNETDNNVGHK